MRVGAMLSGALVAALMGVSARGQEAASKIMAMPAAELMATVERDDATTFERAKAIQRLGVVGTAEAIPVVAARLSDEQLNAYACSALVAMDSPEADAALRDAADKLSGRPLVGVLDAIGQRRDAAALGVLRRHLTGADSTVRSAAAAALGNVGTREAAEALKAALAHKGTVLPAIGEACLACAEQLAADAPEAAAELYDRLIESSSPKPLRLAAMLGRVRLSPDKAAPWVQEQLASEDVDHFNAALTAAREVPGEAMFAALAQALPKLAGERRALVLQAMGDRGDSLPAATLAAEMQNESPVVREAAIEVLAARNDAPAAAVLIEAAFGDGPAASLALERLKSLSGRHIDQAVIERASSTPKRTSVALLELVGARRLVELKPLVREQTADQNAEVRAAAIVALGQVGELADVDFLMARALRDGDDAETEAARRALRTVCLRVDDREACAKQMVDVLEAADADQRAFLLRLLREMGAGCDTALNAVVAAARSEHAALKDAGTRELGAWPTPAAAEALLEIAKNDPAEKYRIRALRGYIRIARQLQLSDQERIEFFHKAQEVAERDEERRLALDILERVPSVESLNLATSFLDDAPLADDAGETAVRIASKLILSEPAAVAAAMEKVKSAADVDLSPASSQLADALLQRAAGSR